MSEYDPNYHLKPPTFQTVREVELSRLLSLALPYLIVMRDLSHGDKLTELVERITREVA